VVARDVCAITWFETPAAWWQAGVCRAMADKVMGQPVEGK
jgi:hypothetical protein